MSFELWLSFIAASSLLCFTPGPTVLLVMGQSLTHGSKSTIPLVAGVLIGDVIAMSLSFLGMGVLLSTSAELFTVLKWLGAAYLVYLGIKTLVSKPVNTEQSVIIMKKKSLFWHALVVTALNPKGIIFFLAFFPLFIDTTRAAIPQMWVMAVTFLFVSCLSATCYSFFSGMIKAKVTSKSFQSIFNKISGSLLIGAGTLTAAIKK